jgi:hypothetical protein
MGRVNTHTTWGDATGTGIKRLERDSLLKNLFHYEYVDNDPDVCSPHIIFNRYIDRCRIF